MQPSAGTSLNFLMCIKIHQGVGFPSPSFSLLPSFMKKFCTRLYQSMQEDLCTCRQRKLSRLQEIECSFQVACMYWSRLRKQLTVHVFETEIEEIDFFRNCKPMFISEIMFWELLNHLEIFRPERRESYRKLLLRENTRLEKFTWSHREFFDYYKSGETGRDWVYFVRRPDLISPDPSPYDRDGTTCTSHDHLVAQLLALERYDAFLQGILQKLAE